MFSVFGKKPTDEELERAVLHASILAKMLEQKTSKLCSDTEITNFLESMYEKIGVKPSSKQKKLAIMSVSALMVQTPFFKELLKSGVPSIQQPLSNTTRANMIGAIKKSVSEFQRDSQ